MADPMTPPMGGKPPMGNNVLKNLSPGNPADARLMAASGEVTQDMTVREYFEKMGVDVDGPITQLLELGNRMKANANPITKMRNIAAGASLKPGGQPPTMPGVKPMVEPPGKPAPAGLEGLMQKLGR